MEDKILNPMNGAGEFLYFENNTIKDEIVEGIVIEGFNNGINATSDK